ncbi:pyridoxal-phosphate dependent enzyme [Puniceicoccus vermicola]|uniref:threonine ammonia-lyase n=1 Tax=Puniceicoccus vermicola TaxID=388746 RepID=A0A7X1E4P1_9BACT|nr:pyridoxal-phosphate dependent enzyme [Puniceicoccus vermicola]MBC2602346.1 pyridoxal-phosphate dependent enzyme [Puniceicoccus vermicola]
MSWFRFFVSSERILSHGVGMTWDKAELENEILLARQRVYRAGTPTPLETLELDGLGEIYVKREDISPIKAYKWRGSFNRMALIEGEDRKLPVIAASAGNHAQGVALAAKILGLKARIYMPTTTPAVKRSAVLEKGGDSVEIVLIGDGYDDALAAAKESAKKGGVFVHAYDDLHVIAGQATIADEVVLSGKGPFDVAYLQIGGGGMAAGVATWMRKFYPGIRIIGVEGEGQASMAAAVNAGKPVRLDELDIFCDGTAVRQAGELTHQICSEVIDEFVTVSNEEVSDAIRLYWESLRCLQEPSGAMGLAGLRKHGAQHGFSRALVVACGANIDFGQLSRIADLAGIGGRRRRHVRINIPEKSGTMLGLFRDAFEDLSVIDFQYGKTDPEQAWPVFGFGLTDQELEALLSRLKTRGYEAAMADESASVRFRAIPCEPRFLSHPAFLEIDFYERPGALRGFLDDVVRGEANLCYFNYRYSGERIGRALIALEFGTDAHRSRFCEDLPFKGSGYRQCRILSEEEADWLVPENSAS